MSYVTKIEEETKNSPFLASSNLRIRTLTKSKQMTKRERTGG